MATRITSREFNQHTSRAKQAAAKGPVYITDRGRPAHVLLTYDDYTRLLDEHSLTEILGEPAGIEDVDLPDARVDERPRTAEFS